MVTRRQIRLAVGWILLAVSVISALFLIVQMPIIYFVSTNYFPGKAPFTVREIADVVLVIAGLIFSIWLLRGVKKTT